MDNFTALSVVAILAFALAAAGIALAIPWLRAFGAIADENDRTMHEGRIPKGGGAPLLIAAIIAIAVIGLPLDPVLMTCLASLAALSLINDRRSVPFPIRLLAHLTAASAIAVSLPGDVTALQGTVPQWMDRAVIIIALAWMMNLYNFMDGINGIAGAETVAISIGYLAIVGASPSGASHAPVAAAVIGATVGFLIWNLRPVARVFLGDAGSVPLGLLMGVLMLDLAGRGYWAAALILPATFVADASLTLLQRMAAGEKFWHAHKSHHYQRAAQRLGAHLPVVGMMTCANSILIVLALWSITAPWPVLAGAIATVALLFWALGRAGRFLSSDSGP